MSSSPKRRRRKKPSAEPRTTPPAPAPRAKTSAKRVTRARATPRSATISFALPQGSDFVFDANLPLLPLRDVVIFPGMMAPLVVGRPASVSAVERAIAGDKVFVVVAQRDPQESEPAPGDLHSIGTVVRAAQALRVPDGTIRVLVEGVCRVELGRVRDVGDHLAANVRLAEPTVTATTEVKALTRSVISSFQEYVQLHRRIPDEMAAVTGTSEDPRIVANAVAGHMLLPLATRQELLESSDAVEMLQRLQRILSDELEVLRLEQKIDVEVRGRVSKGQKEFYLQEQLRAIRKELGESGSDVESEAQALRDAVAKAGMPKEAREKALEEIGRLQRMGPMSPEATVVRTYVETLLALPWKKRTRDRLNLKRAEAILNEDHYGLAKVKERILEYLAVVKLVKKPRGSILCLVGPPGVGKTSLGRSIARALGRQFVRVSLGGVRDEAEIRGHRRTYIGSMPGRIIQGLRRAGSRNPVFLMDEIDKLAADFRGDPAAALLEVLDPEQNRTFNDHYLDVDFDLSEVLFVTTANVLPAIPPALRDRMEVLRLPGYLEHEKLGIARNFLLPKQLADHGLGPNDLELTGPAWSMLITRYTREAGVRNLEREIAALCRKIARRKLGGEEKRARLGPLRLEKLLGPPRYAARRVAEEDRVGVSYGLAWTEFGGDILPIQVMVLPGRGKISLTGRLGEVMRESARIALSYARSRAASLGLSADFAERVDLHVHMPEGAIPKDGPSAGVSIATAVVSALTRIPVRRDVAMTGEITLLGNVLPIGGLKEKAVAAAAAGFQRVLVPKDNEPDWQDVSEEARKRLHVTFVSRVDDVLRHALVSGPALERLLGAEAQPDSLPGLLH